MMRQFVFLAGALCIIATISLLRLHIIDAQYAAVALSTTSPSATSSAATTQTATSTAHTTLPRFPVITKLATTTPVKKTATTTPAKAVKAQPIISSAEKVASIPTPSAADFDKINAVARNAVVNIACVTPNSDSPISGSGVIIDPRGVILTNAHVGQYVLLQDSDQVSITCTVRTGSPATDAWHVEVLYLSSEWMAAHASDIKQDHPMGTGENDYALLRVTSSVNGTPLPSPFPSIGFNSNYQAVNPGQSVLVASYPAGFLGSIQAFYNLNLISTVTTLKEIFTFSDAHTADLVSLGGIIVAQGGSSGGAVVDQWKNLVAIVVTASSGSATSDRDLRAITLFHINQSMMTETKVDLASYIKGDLGVTEAAFKKGLEPDLIKELINALMGK